MTWQGSLQMKGKSIWGQTLTPPTLLPSLLASPIHSSFSPVFLLLFLLFTLVFLLPNPFLGLTAVPKAGPLPEEWRAEVGGI